MFTNDKKRLAVIPSDSIKGYLSCGYGERWLEEYYNPCKFFDEVYLLSPLEDNSPNLLGMKAIRTEAKELKGRLRELNIDIVRAYGGYWACDMACKNKIRGVPVVVSVHDTDPEKLFKSIKRADAVFCMSAAVRDLVLTKKRNNEKVWILPNRINFDEMRPFARESLSDLEEKFPFQFRILHVGRKRVEKNLDTVIKALKFLGKEYCLIAVGRGTKDVYLKMAEDIGVLENCFFIDVIRNDELAQYYSFASCLCNPSRWEGFGIVFIEALACESVVVTSDIAPMNEYIRHMDNGLLVKDYESPEALAEVIKLGCGNEEIRGRIKKNARKSVERFEQRRIDNLEANYYERIMEMKMQGEFLGGSKYGLRSVVEQLGKVIIGQR